MDFSQPKSKLYDAVLVVEGQKYYVNKKIMTRNCTFFDKLFYSDLQTKEIHLPDVKKKDLQVFLEACYGEDNLDDDRVLGIARLSKKWGCQHLLEDCITFLTMNKDMSELKRLELAVELEMEEMKHQILNNISSVEQLNAIVPKDIRTISPKVMAPLLQKAMKFHRPRTPPGRASPTFIATVHENLSKMRHRRRNYTDDSDNETDNEWEDEASLWAPPGYQVPEKSEKQIEEVIYFERHMSQDAVRKYAVRDS